MIKAFHRKIIISELFYCHMVLRFNPHERQKVIAVSKSSRLHDKSSVRHNFAARFQ